MSSLPQQHSSSVEPGEDSYGIDNLCATCSSAFSKALEFYNIERKMLSECDESYVLVCDGLAKRSVEHHDSFHDLRQAARAGCHLCNLMETYCTSLPIDPDVSIMLRFDIRSTASREYALDVTGDKECTQVRLGLKDSKYTLPQLSKTYYHPTGGVPDAIFDMIGDWLRQCQAHHQACRDDSSKHIPTRLVDVSTLESSTVQLVETGNGFQAPYLTLSHCWGQNANITRRTSGGNLAIPFKSLPRTFRDAITATRKLGFAYLWIDSLCIIQSDQADWERESSKMASIYSKGVLNLAASYSSDSHGGLFLERNQHHVTPCSWKQQIDPVFSRNPYGEWMQSTHVCWTFDPQSEFGDLGLGRPIPLTSRGWVLQENVLSPRTVHFLPGEIIWECRELSAKESLYCRLAGQTQQFRGKFASSPETVPVTRNGPKSFLRIDSEHSEGQETTSELHGGSISVKKPTNHLYSQWYDMVTQYSQKDLTRSDDRLPAIWALAQKFQEATSDEYFSGLWKDDVLTGLLFKRFQPRPGCHTEQTRLGPSWSWASTECRVEFQGANSLPSSSSVEIDQLPDASLQGFFIDPSEPRSLSMGRTRQAELEIQTLAREVVGRRHNWNPSPGEKVAKAMGVPEQELHSDIWKRYEQLSREYDRKLGDRPPLIISRSRTSSSSEAYKESWIRLRASEKAKHLKPLNWVIDCYFGWAGAQFIEEERWEMRNNTGRSNGQDKILFCRSFDLDFDTIELAERYEERPVLCLHIKGRYGLLVELDGSSQLYRRVGIYRQERGNCETYAWEPMTVKLI